MNIADRAALYAIFAMVFAQIPMDGHSMNLADLKAPFPPDAVHWRVGSTNQNKTRGMALAYIDARDVMDRLDEVCGQDGWQSKFEAVGGRVVCSIGVDVPMNAELGLEIGRRRRYRL